MRERLVLLVRALLARAPLALAPVLAMGVGVCGLGACAVGPGAAPRQERSNVILFVVDTLRADALSVNGYPVGLTPRIDRLAVEGINFTAAYAPATWTKPSMATLFTGTYADRHGLRTPYDEIDEKMVAERLRPQFHTLAERFRDGGWKTVGFVNQVHLQPKLGFDQGFEHYEWSTGRTAHEVNRSMLAWLEAEPEGPVFLYLHYLDPHWPYTERVEELREPLGTLGVDPKPPRRGDLVDEWLAGGLAPGSIEGLRARYDHGVAYSDLAVTYALRNLEAAGLLDNAIIALTSDHGEGFLEHGRLLHGYAPYEEVLRVPMVIRPHAAAGIEPRSVRQPVGLVDLMPTLLDLAGLPPTRDGDRGRSLVPLMRGETTPARPVYAETAGVRSLRSGSEKVLRFPDGEVEFYDLEADPGETSPLPCEERCRELLADLDLLVELESSGGVEPGEAVELDERDLERLRALGYLDG